MWRMASTGPGLRSLVESLVEHRFGKSLVAIPSLEGVIRREVILSRINLLGWCELTARGQEKPEGLDAEPKLGACAALYVPTIMQKSSRVGRKTLA